MPHWSPVAGGGGSSSTSSNNDASTASSNAPVPVVNSQRLYAVTIVDNSNNTINETVRDTVDLANQDGSLTYTEDDPNNNTVNVDGTTYSVGTSIIAENSSHQELTQTITNSSGTQTVCTFSPHGSGVTYPITLGQSWTLQYTYTCSANAPITYTQTGTAVDIESVTVPAGTFSTYKLQSTIVWTNAGTTRTETITDWRDVMTRFKVKQVINTSYSGTVPTSGYAVSKTSVLQSSS